MGQESLVFQGQFGLADVVFAGSLEQSGAWGCLRSSCTCTTTHVVKVVNNGGETCARRMAKRVFDRNKEKHLFVTRNAGKKTANERHYKWEPRLFAQKRFREEPI